MIRQKRIGVKVEETDVAVTGLGGVPALVNLAHDMELLRDVNALLPAKEQNRGYERSARHATLSRLLRQCTLTRLDIMGYIWYIESMENNTKMKTTTIRITEADHIALSDYGRLHGIGTLSGVIRLLAAQIVRGSIPST